MLDWHLGMLERPDGTALPRLGIANILSLGRAAAIPLLPLLTPTALGVTLVVAARTDVADGVVARARKEASRLGAWLDGAVDAVLLSVAALAESNHVLLPTPVAALVVFRYLLPWPTLATIYFFQAQAPSRDGYVSGRAPGAAVFAGLALAAFGIPRAEVVVAAGAIGGLATFAATAVINVRRSRRARVPGETTAPPLAAPRAFPPGRDGSSASIARRSNASASRARTLG
jgi:cardiolipin synthase